MRKVLTVLGVLVLLIAIIAGVGQWMNSENSANNRSGVNTETPEERTEAESPNPPGCVDYEVISIPGSWESRADDDPFNPTANPHALLLNVTRPLQEQTDPARVKVFTVPYAAQFRNINDQNQLSYDDSRKQGIARAVGEIQQTNSECPATKFIIVGFSQGAVIGGDLASNIGNGRGPIDPDLVAGVSLVADGRQEVQNGELVGNKANTGIGAEIALHPVNAIVQPIVPGATMRGSRPDGFGALNNKVKNFCAPGDTICDAPQGIGNAIGRAKELIENNGVHAQYATNRDVVPDMTAPEWIVGWARGLTEQPIG